MWAEAMALLAHLLRRAIEPMARRAARMTLLLAFALLFAMFGLTGFAAAAFILLSRLMDPALAALLMGAICFLLAAILVLLARGPARAKAPPPPDTTVLLPLALAALIGLLLTLRRK